MTFHTHQDKEGSEHLLNIITIPCSAPYIIVYGTHLYLQILV
uniref:Alpha-carbonic anhydrase domain-containing protein n=1 Tax=Rhizophora mucronata TaxID=61149 RepID=A0A2P2R224_RHIMU